MICHYIFGQPDAKRDKKGNLTADGRHYYLNIELYRIRSE